MPRRTVRYPLAQDEVAAAANQAEAAAKKAAAEGTGSRFVKFTRTKRIMKRNQQPANCWLWSPGTLYFSRSADWELTDNAKARGVVMTDQFVKRIAVGHFEENVDIIYVWATHSNDPDGFDIVRESNITANVSEYFFLHGLVRPAGVKEKFDLLPADQEIEGGPALCFHMDKPTAKGTFETTKKKKSAGNTAAKAEAAKPDETKTETKNETKNETK